MGYTLILKKHNVYLYLLKQNYLYGILLKGKEVIKPLSVLR